MTGVKALQWELLLNSGHGPDQNVGPVMLNADRIKIFRPPRPSFLSSRRFSFGTAIFPFFFLFFSFFSPFLAVTLLPISLCSSPRFLCICALSDKSPCKSNRNFSLPRTRYLVTAMSFARFRARDIYFANFRFLLCQFSNGGQNFSFENSKSVRFRNILEGE